MVRSRSCKKKNMIRCKKTMKGGDCGCSGSGLFKGGSRKKGRISKRKRVFKGGMNMNPSPGLSDLLNWNRYPLNSYQNDPSDPSKLINGRFTAVPNLVGGSRSTKTQKRQRKNKKMKGGNILNFASSFGNSSNINVASNALLGANVVNPPGFLQSASVVNASTNHPYGYSDQNPYMV